MKTWAQRIADLEASGWSLSAIGLHIGLSPQSLSDIKQGRSKEPRGMAAVRLYAMDGMRPDDVDPDSLARHARAVSERGGPDPALDQQAVTVSHRKKAA